MANTKSAIKRIRSSERKHLRNRTVKSRTRTFVKNARQLIAGGDIAEAQAAALKALQELDRAASKGVIHRNNADRRKSRLMKALNRIQQTA